MTEVENGSTSSAASDLCPHCGQPMPDHPVEAEPEMCDQCGRPVVPGQPCTQPDCPKLAAERIHQSALQTPFKLGL